MGVFGQIILALMATGAIWFLVPFALRKLSERQLAQLCRRQKAVVLSYDDGPGRVLTPALLDLLARRRAVATFFVLGGKAEGNRTVLTRTLQEGHEIGSHSFDHDNAWKVWPVRAVRDLAAGIRAVHSLGGDGRLLRPPYGKMTHATLVLCRLRGQRLGWWTVDTKDTRDPDARRSIDEIIAQIRAMGGGVVLAHDFDSETGQTGGMSHDDYVLGLTGRVIEFAEENGYRVMRLGDLYREAKS